MITIIVDKARCCVSFNYSSSVIFNFGKNWAASFQPLRGSKNVLKKPTNGRARSRVLVDAIYVGVVSTTTSVQILTNFYDFPLRFIDRGPKRSTKFMKCSVVFSTIDVSPRGRFPFVGEARWGICCERGLRRGIEAGKKQTPAGSLDRADRARCSEAN